MSKVFNMVGGGGGPAASIFVTGLSETDAVTATKGAKTLAGKWTQKPNPAAHGLPDGYTELTHIESTGTQYINTGVAPNKPLKVVAEASFASSSQNWHVLIATNTSHDTGANGYHVQRRDSGVIGYQYNNNSFIDSSKTLTSDVFYKIEFDAKAGSQNLFVDDELVASSTDANFPNNTNNLFIFACDSAGTATWGSALKSKYLSLESNSEILRNFIPCKRNSDGAIGLYDLCGSASPFDGTPFYGNSGTGTFIAGVEVPQTIDGHMLSPIREFGTWTVTATDGVQTTTQDVLVDVITNYEIEMTYKPVGALYWLGDECEDITGGWTNSGYTNNSVDMRGGEKRSKSLYFANTGTDNYAGFGTVNTVNLNSINGIKVEVVSGSFGGYDALLLTKSKTNYAVSANEVKELRLTDTGTFALDVSEITTSVYIMLRCGSGTTLEIGKVWLE